MNWSNPIVLRLSLVVAALALAWAIRRVWRMLAIGAAYKASILATTIFGAGRPIDPDRALEISADSYWVLRIFRARIDPASRSVTASFLGLRPRTATFPASPAPRRMDRWRHGRPSSALNDIVLRSFTEPSPRRRRTRAVLIVRNGEIMAEQYAAGFGPDSPFAGWSMTKSVLGSMIGILIGEGRLSLTDRELMPAWRAPDPRAGISLEDLLRMRSGLRFSEVYSDLSSDVIEMLFNSPDVVDYAVSRPLAATPGTCWTYASGTTNILSGIVRRILGDDVYVTWPRHVLFDPIGMDTAVLGTDARGNFVCSSFMLATARDWARFGQLQVQDGVWNGTRVIPEGWVRFCTTPTPQSPSQRYGAHWWLKLQPEMGGDGRAASRIPSDAFFAVGHEGQTLTVIPSQRIVIVRLGLSIYVDAWNQAEFVSDVIDALAI